jgi:hypothetical protein
MKGYEMLIEMADTSNHHSSLPVSSTLSSFMSLHTRILPAPSSDANERISLQEKDFTTQAALSLTKATQTNNLVNSRSYYDMMFRTSTSGAVKTIEFNFLPSTYVGTALLVEATGIGLGKALASGSAATGQTITYTVDNAVNIPAFTKIRIQLANINNPSTPSDYSLTVTITTKNSAGDIIDGPTSTQAYSMKPIGSVQHGGDVVLIGPVVLENILKD